MKNKNSIRAYVSLVRKAFAQPVFYSFSALFLAGFLIIFSSCDTTEPEKKGIEIVRLEVTPDLPTIEVGETVKFNAFAITADGDKIPLPDLNLDNWDWEWESLEPEIATINENGLAVGKKAGVTICVIKFGRPDNYNSSNRIRRALMETLFAEASNGSSNLSPAITISLLKALLVIPILFDSFGIEVVQPAELRAKYNLKKVKSPQSQFISLLMHESMRAK